MARRDPERAEYERLRAKYEGRSGRGRPRRDEPDDDDDEDGDVYVFSGRSARGFLDRMFGPGGSHRGDDDDQADEPDDDEPDDEPEDEPEDDPAPRRSGHRFFEGRRG